MADPTLQNSSALQASPSLSGGQAPVASPPAVQTTPDPLAVAVTDAALKAAAAPVIDPAKPTRPEFVPESFWDAEKGEVKVKDFAAEVKTLSELKAAEDARKASLPKDAAGYKAELPKDFKFPDGWEINAADPRWEMGRKIALENGWSQDQFSKAATIMVADDLAKQEALKEAIGKRDAALGQNGPQRVDALNKSVLAAANQLYGEKGVSVAQQVASMFVTPDIIGFLEKVMNDRASQGVASFNGTGRGDAVGRTDGRPEGYAGWSALDQRTYDLQNVRKSA